MTTDSTTGDSTTDAPTATPGDGGLVDTAVLQLGTSMTSDWYHDDERPGRVVAIDSQDRAQAVLHPERLDDETLDEMSDFLSATSFDESLLVLVETVGPSTCYSEVAVADVRLESGTLRASAEAVDTSEEGEGCGDAITFSAALLRATVDGTPPTTATVTLTSGLGDSAALTASVDDPLGPRLEDLAGSVRPDGDPPATPAALDCSVDGFERHGTGYDDVAWGAATDDDGQATFGLRTDTLAAAYGDTVTVTLTNVTDATQYTGNRHKYNLEVLTEDGWQDVRGTDGEGPVGYTDEAVGHAPGEGFEWELELTESGVLAGHVYEDSLSVCPDLPSGRYRFVFWEPTVAVAFDVER